MKTSLSNPLEIAAVSVPGVPGLIGLTLPGTQHERLSRSQMRPAPHVRTGRIDNAHIECFASVVGEHGHRLGMDAGGRNIRCIKLTPVDRLLGASANDLVAVQHS